MAEMKSMCTLNSMRQKKRVDEREGRKEVRKIQLLALRERIWDLVLRTLTYTHCMARWESTREDRESSEQTPVPSLISGRGALRMFLRR